MPARPYLYHHIAKLEEIYDKSINDLSELEQLRHELSKRTTYRAQRLAQKVDEAIRAKSELKKMTVSAPAGVETRRRVTESPSATTATAARQQHGVSGAAVMGGTSPENPVNAYGATTVTEQPALDGTKATDTVNTPHSDGEFPLTPEHLRLIDLVDYVRHMVQLMDRPVFALKDYKQLLYHEEAFKGRIGIHHDLGDEDGAVWLKIERLKRIDPPAVPPDIQAWVTVTRDPNRVPAVQDVRTSTISKDKAEELIAQRLLDRADVQPALKAASEQQLCDVIYRLDRDPTVKKEIADYISGPWTKWAETEKPRRETISIYDAFFSAQQSILMEGADQPLEIVWGIGMARWRVKGREIDHPLIEQLVELHISTDDGAMTIRPRSADPQLALKPYFALEVPGVDIVLNYGREFLANSTAEQELSPYIRSTFEPLLRQAVTQLDASGRYHPDDAADITSRKVPDITQSLAITDTWVIYVRRRSDNFFIADLERLKETIKTCKELPGPAQRLVSEPSDTPGYTGTIIDLSSGNLGGSWTGTGSGNVSSVPSSIDDTQPQDFFFPKAFNEAQVSIIKRLAQSDGMVVQGPPGTGKTHTIANIICHYLATGKRVLVTSKGEAALTVLREHIPEGIRDLVISLLTNEREGLKQLETAVTLLANTAVQVDPRRLEREIISGQERILELQKRIAAIEEELRQWASKHLKHIGGGAGKARLLPMELAQKIRDEGKGHEWFPDSLTSNAKSSFTDEDIASARQARRQLGTDIVYLSVELPSLSDLPDTAALAAVHQDLVNASELDKKARIQQLPMLTLSANDAVGRAKKLLQSIDKVIEYFDAIEDSVWLHDLFEIWRKEGQNVTGVKLLNDITKQIETITVRRTVFVREAVAIPGDAHCNPSFCEAVEKAARGARPFGLLSFVKTPAHEQFSLVRIAGSNPQSEDEWRQVQTYVVWRKEITAFVARWMMLVPELGLPSINDAGDETARWAARILEKINKGASLIHEHLPLISSETLELFPYGMDPWGISESKAAARTAADVIKMNLSKHRLAASRTRITDLIAKLDGKKGPLVERFRKFVTEEIGLVGLDINQVMDRWQALCQELDHLHNLRPVMVALAHTADMVEASGAPKWATILRMKPVTGTDDPWTPSNWRDSWEVARLRAYLHEIDGRERLQKLSSELMQYDNELKKMFAEVVKLRTFLGLKKNITDRVSAALTLFTTAIRNIGKGTGVRARRFRRNARDAMERSYSAVPCWIMPTSRISESLPADLGSFDLVIVDEASQSDIMALPALIRGKKVLIVGDDKQVSPTAAFIEERKILQLQHNYLKGQPFAAAMLPGGSLYTLAQAMYPSQRVLLREHFRCVEPIIRFSFQFYTEELIPLRLPMTSERLDPPLIDVYVANGRKDNRQINVEEAKAVVDEIEILVDDPAYYGRTMGVVSLVGAKQAHYIQSLLLERIGEEAYLSHDIACGDSATFQGKERDIMFISMVACPLSKSALTSLPFQQRFNVALSRARDREYLFRSVTEDMLKPDDLKAKVIRHFQAPMGNAPRYIGELIELCESGFERDVFQRLSKMGYLVTPQVRVGAYSIDLVVEGGSDQRLAIELDGDKYHTPDRWAEDFARQRTLERVGWRFWRCWGSSYALDPDDCIDDLVATLRSMGIEPIDGKTAPRIYTEHRVVGDENKEEHYDVAAPSGNEDSINLATLSEEVSSYHSGSKTEQASVSRLQEAKESGRFNRPETQIDMQDKSVFLPERFEQELRVQAGDRVLITYNDEPSRQYMLTLSKTKHDPDAFIIKSSMPLAQALIGANQDEEVEIPAGGGTRTVTILKIDRDGQ